MASYERIFRALNEAEVRYVVVGGLAAVLHGHARFTLDIDLVVDLEPEAGRPKDLEDIRKLEQILENREEEA